MTDLLIRDLDPELRRAIEASAKRHRRSLSGEAKLLLQRGLASAAADAESGARGLGSRLALLGREAVWSGDLIESRDDFGREPPFAA